MLHGQLNTVCEPVEASTLTFLFSCPSAKGHQAEKNPATPSVTLSLEAQDITVQAGEGG